MLDFICKNTKCNKKIKKNRKFCSISCFNSYKKKFPKKYKNGWFKNGCSPWNKGRKFLKVGATKIEKIKIKSGEKRYRRLIFVGEYKNGLPRYIRNDRYVWTKKNGKIPNEYTLWHKDGRTLNDDVENLECITIGDAQSRYALLKNNLFNLKSKQQISKIIVGCENGDRRVQKKLYEMMYSKMIGIAIRYSYNIDTAKDIVSDSFLKVFSNIKKVKVEKSNFESWIMRIVVNTSIDYLRKHSKKDNLTYSIDDDFDGDESDFIFNKIYYEENISDKIDGKHIIEFIQQLPPTYKLVFNLIVIEGYSHKQVSNKLGISEGTSKSNLFKAKRILKEKIISLNEEDKKNIINLENYYEPEE